MLSARVANDGVLMKPYLVQKVTAPDLSAVATTIPTPLSTPVTPTQAAHLQTMMTSVVQSPFGTAHATAGTQVTGGIEIAGKTGTAQNGINNSGLDDAVFTGYAQTTKQQIAVDDEVKGDGNDDEATVPPSQWPSSGPTPTPRGRGEARDHGSRRDADDWPPARSSGIRRGPCGARWTDNYAGRLLTCET